ncbi:hypothetical protein PANDA_018286, partial [Ailuropoda melanoleuca]
MVTRACCWLVSALWGPRVLRFAGAQTCLHPLGSRRATDRSERTGEPALHLPLALLEFLVCPLSQEASQICEAPANKLINEELGIAYPIIHGVPNMTPKAARMTHQNKKQEEMEQ